jgi:hypothetical protein
VRARLLAAGLVNIKYKITYWGSKIPACGEDLQFIPGFSEPLTDIMQYKSKQKHFYIDKYIRAFQII